MGSAQLRVVLHLVGELADAPTPEEFSLRAGDTLRSLIAAQAVSFNEWDYGAHRLTGFHDRAEFRPELAYLHELWPQCEWLLRMPPPDRVWRVETMSDSVPLRDLRRREVYACVYRPIRIDHFLAITIGVSGRRRAALLLDRDRGEFTDDERALAQLFTPPLVRLYRSVRARARLAARLGELERALRNAPGTRGSPEGFRDLTARELEVLEHVAVGRTDREIATLLYVSVRTVQKHLQHAYEKLGVRTRTAAAMLVFGDRR
jgi:DNA-binding CsgD family transcriptional regulator